MISKLYTKKTDKEVNLEHQNGSKITPQKQILFENLK